MVTAVLQKRSRAALGVYPEFAAAFALAPGRWPGAGNSPFLGSGTMRVLPKTDRANPDFTHGAASELRNSSLRRL
jgi:hypothetical protein